MQFRKPILLLLCVLLVVVSSQAVVRYFKPSDVLPRAQDINGEFLANTPPVSESIKFVQNRLKQNPKDAVSYTLLGDLYIRQARETGDVSGYQRAEESLNHALELLPNYFPAMTLLASVHYSRHEFDEALATANQALEIKPENPQAQIIVADAYLALGNYDEAETIFREIAEDNATPSVLARLANLEELKGNSDEALALIRRAAGEALQSGGTKENAAWYVLRVADMYYNHGDIRKAGEYYEASLRVYENYYLALAGLGKVSAAQGKYEEAISYYQRAVNIVPQPDYLAALGDLYSLTGKTDQARIQYNTVEYIGGLAELNQQVYNRQLANFYSDHDISLEKALNLALAELETRKDIYGYDAAAWAEYKNGNYQKAQEYMEQAMALGTQDARLYFHAGMIAYALGQNQSARDYLEQAMDINPHFSILDFATANETLERLQAAAAK